MAKPVDCDQKIHDNPEIMRPCEGSSPTSSHHPTQLVPDAAKVSTQASLLVPEPSRQLHPLPMLRPLTSSRAPCVHIISWSQGQYHGAKALWHAHVWSSSKSKHVRSKGPLRASDLPKFGLPSLVASGSSLVGKIRQIQSPLPSPLVSPSSDQASHSWLYSPTRVASEGSKINSLHHQ